MYVMCMFVYNVCVCVSVYVRMCVRWLRQWRQCRPLLTWKSL